MMDIITIKNNEVVETIETILVEALSFEETSKVEDALWELKNCNRITPEQWWNAVTYLKDSWYNNIPRNIIGVKLAKILAN